MNPMPTGRPIATKCPACKRGKHGFSPPTRGVERTAQVRVRKTFNTRRPGSTLRTERVMRCRDCGHTWWTTLEDGIPAVDS